MRILFISNLYPPHELGGMEQLCEEAVVALQRRGHHCHVLTSCFGVNRESPVEQDATRSLYLDADIHYYRPLDFFLQRGRRLNANKHLISQTVEKFKPDIVFIWGMWNLSYQVAYWAEKLMPGRLAYAVASYWLVEPDPHQAYWSQSARRLVPRLLMAPARHLALRQLRRERLRYHLNLEHVACVSEYVRHKLETSRVLPNGARVIYNGIDPQPFISAAASCVRPQDGLRLIYTGGLLAHKGVHTAIEALGVLKHRRALEGVSLTIVGGGHPDYEKKLRNRVSELQLDHCVTFTGRVSRSEIARLLAGHHVFLFTSEWEEPIARTVMEAMASGLAVLGTPVGGQPEILKDRFNGLIFPVGDSERLADYIDQLRQNPDWRRELADAGRAWVLERFTLTRMVNEMESWLFSIIA